MSVPSAAVSAPVPVPLPRTDGQHRVELSIQGMTCAACAARITKKLNAIDAVSATVNYATDTAVVDAPEDLPVQALVDEIVRAGYRAEPVVPAAVSTSAEAGSGSEDDPVRSLGRRLLVAAVLFMPLCDASLVFSLVPVTRFFLWQWVVIALAAPVVVWAAWPIHAGALRAARHGACTMDTLVSMGILASTGWSLYVLFFHPDAGRPVTGLAVLTHPSNGALYLDVAAGVTTFLLAGRYYEAVSKRRTGDVLRSLAASGAKEVSVLRADGLEHRVPIEALRVGDHFVARAGATVATDGTVVSGEALVDTSLVTGESRPVETAGGDRVVGGTVVAAGRVVVEATEVGGATQLAQMVAMVETAQNEQAAVQRLADRVAGVFVPAVMAVAAVTFVAWSVLDGSIERAFSAALAVLIIACPCSLGLATPTALFVASGRAAQLGIFIKGYQALERSRAVDTVVLDKTGTLTVGAMRLVAVEVASTTSRHDLLRLAGALESASEHAIAAAVVDSARAEAGPVPAVAGFHALPGLGARGTVEGHDVVIGRADVFPDQAGPDHDRLGAVRHRWEDLGRTVVTVGIDGEVVGVLALADTLKPSAAAAVGRLQQLGLHCMLLTGDSAGAAGSVARAVGIDDVVSGAKPADKVELIGHLQAAGRQVAFVGDGVNDGPALIRADLGLAVGAGTDVAIHAADMILIRDDLDVVPTAITLARATLGTIRANLVWAFAYNLAAIPLAALGFLDPLIAGASMALSSTFVVWNSSRLRHFDATPSAEVPVPEDEVHADGALLDA